MIEFLLTQFGTSQNVNISSTQDGLKEDLIYVCIKAYTEQIVQHWKDNQGGGYRPWFSMVKEPGNYSVITHCFDGIVPVRVDAAGNPLSIQRDLGEALLYNEQLRKGLRTNPYMEGNNLTLQGRDNEESMVIMQPTKGCVGRLFIENQEVLWDEDESFRFVFTQGNKKDDLFLKLDPTDSPSTGESKQGQSQLRKDLRTIMLSGMNEEVRSRLDLFNSNGNAVEEAKGSPFFKVETDELHYIGRPASDICTDGYFAVAYVEAFGQLTEAYKAKGQKNKARRFDVSHVRAYLMPDIISKEGQSVRRRKGKKLKDGVNPGSNKPAPGKAEASTPKEQKQEAVAPQLNWPSVELSFIEDETGQRRWLTNGHDVAEKGWSFHNITNHFALFKKEGKVLLHLFGDVSAFEQYCRSNEVGVSDGYAYTNFGNLLVVATGDYLGDVTEPKEPEELEEPPEESPVGKGSSIASASGVNEEEIPTEDLKPAAPSEPSEIQPAQTGQVENRKPRGGVKKGLGKNKAKKSR